MIKVLVVDDSPTVRSVIAHVLNADPEITVIGTASDGLAALEFLKHNSPDVITMDVHMPRMDGLEATARIMETRPVPIIIVSASWEPDEVDKTFQAMEVGAVAVASKPAWTGHAMNRRVANDLVQSVKTMAGVKLVRRWPRRDTARAGVIPAAAARPGQATANPRLVAIGASTGGPLTLRTILAGLPEDFPVPIAVVQHIAPGFLPGLVRWLSASIPLRVEIAADGACLQPGHVYFAPDGQHLGIERGGRTVLSLDDPENGLRPSVSHLFRSVARELGPNAIGVLLTGMGSDGARGLRVMKEEGALTVVQDQESAVVHGMPSAAIELDAVCHVLPPDGIVALLRHVSGSASELKGRFAK